MPNRHAKVIERISIPGIFPVGGSQTSPHSTIIYSRKLGAQNFSVLNFELIFVSIRVWRFKTNVFNMVRVPPGSKKSINTKVTIDSANYRYIECQYKQ